MSRDPHDWECASAALAARLERAIKDGDKETVKVYRKLIAELNAELDQDHELDRAVSLDSIGWFG